MPDHRSATLQLHGLLPPGTVHLDKENRFRCSLDNLRLSFMPDAVITPQEEEDIATVLQLANEHRVPIVPRGAGTATTGATAPVQGGWVIDLNHWNTLSIDSAAAIAYAQPGVTVKHLADEASRQGLFYPPDPSSLKFATVGGTIACNAGGLRGAKYGVTRDYVLALEGFLPNGEWVRWGADLRKFASGLNMRDLWIGSEGQLGIITGAVLKLIPAPAATATALFAFPNENEALDAVREILNSRLMPSILEFLDRQTVACTETAWNRPLFTEHPAAAVLLIEWDGHPAEVAETREKLLDQIAPQSLAARFADFEEERRDLWTLRRSCSRAMFQMGDTKLNEDVVVPLARQKDLLAVASRLREETGLATPTFGHAADGNFHVHIMFNRADAAQKEKAENAVNELMREVVALGGAITGEHGIGLAKSPFFQLQHSPAEIAAMRAVKSALDPHSIMNPGKIFAPFEVWRHDPVDVTLPWDH